MLRYILGRIGQALLVIWVAFTVSYLLLQALPGDAIIIKFMSPDLGLGPDQIQALREAYGVDVPLWQQYLQSLGQFLTGNFGYSVQGSVPVSQRFGFLKAPKSTVLQPGPVHGGVTEDPARQLDHLLDRLVG